MICFSNISVNTLRKGDTEDDDDDDDDDDDNNNNNNNNNFHSCTVHLDIIEYFIYPTDAQLDCSKNANIYIKIYMRCAPLM
jgi:hypothetical protein